MIKRFFGDLFRSVLKHNVGSLAAIIAFFGFSSLLPLLALILLLVSVLVPEVYVAKFIQDILQSYLPATPDASSFAASTVQHLTAYRTHLRVIGVFGMLWGSIGGFVTLQQILDTIYEVRQRRSFWKQYVIGFVMMGILLAITLSSSIISAIAPPVLPAFVPVSVSRMVILPFVQAVGHVTFSIVLFITCFYCYRVLPTRKIRFIPAMVGAFVTSAIIYISRYLFVIYTHHLGNYHLMYGALSFVMLLIFWVYIACVILLVGAEVSVTLENIMGKRTHRLYPQAPRRSIHDGWSIRKRQR